MMPRSNGSEDGGREGRIQGYSDEYTPLGGYATLLAAWGGIFGGLLAAGARMNQLPRRIEPSDVVLLGIATHKLTRVLTKDWVTAPLRAPFVHYEESVGAGEVKESARGRGLRKAIGDLVTCTFCSGPWVAGALVAGMVRAPRATRVVVGTFATVAVSDFLHHAYSAVRKASD